VWVCLRAAGGRALLAGRVIAPGDHLPTWHSQRFTMTLGNGDLSMRINGRTLAVPAVKAAIGYVVDRSGRRRVLGPARRPTCS
jgi:hypothetical protein